MKLDKVMLIRTFVLVVALMNQFLTIIGKSPLPFSNEEVESFVSIIFTTSASIWAWWKNNDVTAKARNRTALIKELEGTEKAK